ncbi:MAG: TMEM165/GDT1 family protein [Neofamilia sp.]
MSNFLEAFLLVFVAEMGDKSQLLSLAFATKFKLSTVIIGIALGIGFNHGLAIIAASFISQYIDMDYIQILAAAIFIVFGLSNLRLEYDEEDDIKKSYFSHLGPVVTIASTFFVGELGDKTQILAMTMGAMAENKLMVFVATFSSMMVVSIIGIFVGRILKKKIPEVTMNIIASVLFLFFGMTSLWGVFETFDINRVFYLAILIGIVGSVYIIYQGNQKRKDEYFIAEISRNLDNCVGCTEKSCDCSTRENIERLTQGYLGGEVKFLGNMINYIEDTKKISPKKYYNLYLKIKEEKYDERIMLR